ncbi:MAG TPA: cellulase family glycosylhydrolase [Candidatus Dormibacteraeota bacterium]
MNRQVQRSRRHRGESERGPRTTVAVIFAVIVSVLWIELPVDALVARVGAADRPPAQGGLAWLSVRDRRIVDESGRTVLLRGFNTSTLLESTVLRSPLDDEDAAMMESDGFDVVRVAVSWGRMEPQRGQWDQGYLQSIADTVRMLTDHHLYVVLDMHFLDWSSSFGGSGAPAWANLPLAPDLHIGALGDWQRHLSPAVNAANTYFWVSPDWQADFMRAWQLLAQRFRGDSGVAGYDIYNEPHAIPLPPVRFEKDFMWPLYAHTIDAIAAVDPNHLFIVEGQLLSTFGTAIVHLVAPNLVYSPHEYTGSLVPPTFDGNPQPLHDHIRQSVDEATRVPGALWIGEWGMGADQALATTWVDDAVATFTAAGAGWAWWQWREDSPWGVRDTAGHTNMVLLDHLARPYLAAAPAGVTVATPAGAGVSLALTIDSSYDGAAIEVAYPALHHPPQVSSTCTAVSSHWNPTTARLVVSAVAAVTCTIATN